MPYLAVLSHLLDAVTGVGVLHALAGGGSVAALAATVLVTVGLIALTGRTRVPVTGSGRLLTGGAGRRERLRRVGVPRLTDPDAPGRPRPRAPGSHPVA